MFENKEKADNLLKEYILYDKNLINNCPKCTICEKDFIDYSTIVITTKCNHTFHHICFKNIIYTNIICPKCPKCNKSLFDSDNELHTQNNTIIFDQTVQNFQLDATRI